jgi:hypothetical protein
MIVVAVFLSIFATDSDATENEKDFPRRSQ